METETRDSFCSGWQWGEHKQGQQQVIKQSLRLNPVENKEITHVMLMMAPFNVLQNLRCI